MMRVLNLKSSIASFSLFIFLLSFAHTAIAQSKHAIRFNCNPIIYKLGNLEKQYTIIDNRFITANYFDQVSHDFGVEYSIQNKKSGFFAGLSWLHQKHRVNYVVYRPEEVYDWEILNFHDIQLTENLLGIRIGGEFRINKYIKFGLGLNFYVPVKFRSTLPLKGIHYTRYTYSYYNTPDSSYSELSSKLEHKIQRNKRDGLILPELFFTHSLSKNFSLTVGCRYKFWAKQGDWLISYEVNGFAEASESDNERLLFSSKVRNKGIQAFFGLRYTLPIGDKDKLN